MSIRRARKDQDENAVEDLFAVIGGRWKVVLIWNLGQTPIRFKNLQKMLPTISRKMLSQQLKQLEEDGVVRREAFAEIPPRVEYSLTQIGMDLKPLLSIIQEWTTKNSHSYKFKRATKKEIAE